MSYIIWDMYNSDMCQVLIREPDTTLSIYISIPFIYICKQWTCLGDLFIIRSND